MRANHLRYDEVLVVRELLPDQLGVARLFDQVELAAQVHLELVRQRAQLQELCGLRPFLEELDGRLHDPEVEGYLLGDPRQPHLEHDLAPVSEQRRVDLRDRRRRKRPRVEPREHVGAELFPHDTLHLGEG